MSTSSHSIEQGKYKENIKIGKKKVVKVINQVLLRNLHPQLRSQVHLHQQIKEHNQQQKEEPHKVKQKQLKNRNLRVQHLRVANHQDQDHLEVRQLLEVEQEGAISGVSTT